MFEVLDGGRLPCADHDDRDVQNLYYEGYTFNVQVTSLLVFNFFGKFMHAEVNFPGSWNDSKLECASCLLYPKLGNVRKPPGNSILRDSALVCALHFGGGQVELARQANDTKDIPL